MPQFSNDPDEDGPGKDDYYAMLNVPRNASTEDINRAFRQRSRVFHPDRHMDEQNKREAEKFFVRLRKAHEALIDPHKRAIYDSVGVKGLDVAGWELITKTYNAEDIKREYEFLRRLKDAETMLERVQPSSTFCIKTNATDLFRSNEYERSWPEIVAMSMSQSVDCAVTTDDRVTLRGHLKATNGRGGGGMTIGWRRPITDRVAAEGEVSFEEAPIFTLKLSRSFAKYIVAVQPMTILHLDAISLRDAFEPGIGFVFTAQLSQRWRGTLMLRLGQQQSISTTIFYLDLNQPKFIGGVTITPALATSNLRLSYTHRMNEHEAFYRTTAAFGLFGVVSSLTYERRLTRHSRVSCSVRASLPAGSLQTKFRLSRGVNSYEYDVVLCDNQLDLPRAALYGVFVPLIVFHIGRLLLRPWSDDISAFFEGKIEDRQVDWARKEDAIKETELMRATAERIREGEEKKQGLIIVDAKYGEIVSEGGYDSDRTIDVTVALQSLVSDSKLLLYDAGKSQLPGFYDPCPREEKLLRVLYRFRGDLHKVIVKDDQPLCIPKQSHRLL